MLKFKKVLVALEMSLISDISRDIMRDLDESLSCIDQLVEKLRSILVQVHEIVRYRVAVATVQVFPLFIQLSNVWVKMQEEVDILSEINNNFVELSTVTKVPYLTFFN